MPQDNVDSKSLKASISAIKEGKEQFEVKIRLKNEADRALHYISDLRTIKYDVENKTLRLNLSDEDRVLVPGVMAKLPNFRYIDPGGRVDLVIKFPKRIIRLTKPSSGKKIAFETQLLSQMENIVLGVGWSDIPYYKDTRLKNKASPDFPTNDWQQYKASARKKYKSK